MYDEVLTRNADGELEVRVAQSSGDTSTNKDDVFTRDNDGKLALRVTGVSGGGGSGGDVASVNGKKGNVVLTGADINATVTKSTSTGNEDVTETITEHLQYLNDFGMTLQGEVDTNAGKTAELDADVQGKVDKAQGVENAGKILTVGTDGNVTLSQPATASAMSDSGVGLRGDYCCRYGVVEWNSGVPTIGTGNTVNYPGGMVWDIPGTVENPTTSRLTLSSPQTITLTKTTNSILAYIEGVGVEQCDKICFSLTEPSDDGATCQLWWNGQEMQFRSTDSGWIWRAVRVGILGELVYTDGSLTRINRTGWYHYLPATTAPAA